MLTRAAAALAVGRPLEIMEVELDGLQKGEVFVEIKNGFDRVRPGKSFHAVVEF